MKELLCRFDLANGKYLSIFLGVFARIVKVTHFAQVINFRTIEQKRNFTWKIENERHGINFLYKTKEFPPNTLQIKCINKHEIKPKHIK